MQDFLFRFIERFGFPVLICLWFMWRERRIDAMTKQLMKLTVAITSVAKTLDLPENEFDKLSDSSPGG